MERNHFLLLLFFQFVAGALLLTALGIGKVLPEGLSGKNSVGMVASYDLDRPDDTVTDAPVLNKTVALKNNNKTRSSVTSTSSKRTLPATSTTSTVPRSINEDAVYVCPEGIPSGAKRVNSSYPDGYREFYVLPTGAYVGPYVEWYDPYKEQMRSVTCYGPYGAKDGPSMEWSSKGILLSEQNYASGLMSGRIRSYYPGGVLRSECIYLNGKRSGVSRTYHEGGSLKSNASYVDGKRYGAENEYYPDGSLMRVKYYDGDEWAGVSVSYDEQKGEKDIEWRGEIRSGKFSGYYVEWKRGVGCIYKEDVIADCRYLKKEAYRTGEILLETLNMMPGYERMNGVPHFFDEEE